MTAAAVFERTPLWRSLDEIPTGWGPCVLTVRSSTACTAATPG